MKFPSFCGRGLGEGRTGADAQPPPLSPLPQGEGEDNGHALR
jgi:hypothetical protein